MQDIERAVLAQGDSIHDHAVALSSYLRRNQTTAIDMLLNESRFDYGGDDILLTHFDLDIRPVYNLLQRDTDPQDLDDATTEGQTFEALTRVLIMKAEYLIAVKRELRDTSYFGPSQRQLFRWWVDDLQVEIALLGEILQRDGNHAEEWLQNKHVNPLNYFAEQREAFFSIDEFTEHDKGDDPHLIEDIEGYIATEKDLGHEMFKILKKQNRQRDTEQQETVGVKRSRPEPRRAVIDLVDSDDDAMDIDGDDDEKKEEEDDDDIEIVEPPKKKTRLFCRFCTRLASYAMIPRGTYSADAIYFTCKKRRCIRKGDAMVVECVDE
jgi:hypothetical protein